MNYEISSINNLLTGKMSLYALYLLKLFFCFVLMHRTVQIKTLIPFVWVNENNNIKVDLVSVISLKTGYLHGSRHGLVQAQHVGVQIGGELAQTFLIFVECPLLTRNVDTLRCSHSLIKLNLDIKRQNDYYTLEEF